MAPPEGERRPTPGRGFFRRAGRFAAAAALVLAAGPWLTPGSGTATTADAAADYTAACIPVLNGTAASREELTFGIKWGVISAGTAVMRLTPVGNGGKVAHRIESNARSNGFIDVFFKVRDRSSSLAEDGFKRSLYYDKIIREGNVSEDDVIEFDPVDGQSMFFRNGKLRNSLRLPAEYQDPNTGLYRYRMMPSAEPGTSIGLYATDGTRLLLIRADILSREKVTVPAGTFQCLKVELFPEALEGSFKRRKHGRIFLWFSDDACRLPVKMSTEVVIGAVESVLEKVEYKPLTP